MNEKIIIKETSDHTVSQGTICENIFNLSSSLANLDGFDAGVFGEDKKLQEIRLTILDAIYYQSTYLKTEDEKNNKGAN